MIGEAFLFASQMHSGQLRKDGRPYIVHPVEVAFELAKNGATDTLICAGLLHDVIEDAGVTKEQLAEQFPSEVVRLVVTDSEDKSLSWKERKDAMLHALNQTDDDEFKMLMCADKLVNLRNTETEMIKIGENVWTHFKCGKEQQAWLYKSLIKAVSSLDGLPMYRDLQETVIRVFSVERR